VNDERIEMTSVLSHEAAASTRSDRPPVLVAARDVTRRYGEGETAVEALAGVSLAVPAGELTAVMGPSGSGKSTLMHILAGLDRPTAGQVWIDGTNIAELGDTQLTKLRRRHVGFIFQFFNLLPMLTAEENVLLPLELAGRKPERDWGRRAARQRRAGRAAQAPTVGALGRPAAAGRDRARARHEADRGLRRRADRQPRLAHER
jgi:ABC-type sugar transport system ATPase subunit